MAPEAECRLGLNSWQKSHPWDEVGRLYPEQHDKMHLITQGASDKGFHISEHLGTTWARLKCHNQNWVLSMYVLKVKSPLPISRSDITKTNEDLMAKSSLWSLTSLKIPPIHLSKVLAGECWNTINTAGIFLNQQKVTLNGSEDLTAVYGKEKWNQPLHCLWVTDIQLLWCSKPGRLYPNSPIWLWDCG